jgi:hypothetical protein
VSTATKARRNVTMDLTGVMRHVLLIGHWAIKVPALWSWKLFLCGLLANMQERSFAATGWPELCPVVWSIPGGWLIVMRRARMMTDAEFSAFDAKAFCENEDRIIPAELKSNSFGWLEGRVVAVDYGT